MDYSRQNEEKNDSQQEDDLTPGHHFRAGILPEQAVDGLGALEHLPITANGRIGEREKGASEKRRDDAHEQDLHDGHAWKNHGVADVRPVGGSELVRAGEDRRIVTGARNDARHLVERHAEKEEAQDHDRQHEREQYNCTQAHHY